MFLIYFIRMETLLLVFDLTPDNTDPDYIDFRRTGKLSLNLYF